MQPSGRPSSRSLCRGPRSRPAREREHWPPNLSSWAAYNEPINPQRSPMPGLRDGLRLSDFAVEWEGIGPLIVYSARAGFQRLQVQVARRKEAYNVVGMQRMW